MTVIAAVPSAPAAGPALEMRAAHHLRNATILPVLCSLDAEAIRSCQVTASVVLEGRVVVVGRGSAQLGGRPSAHKLAVPVELNDLGRSLVTGPEAMAMTLEAQVHGVDARSFTVTQLHRLGETA